jgi:hypothetical protein
VKRRTPAAVEQDVEALLTLDAKALRARWREVLRTEPPPKMHSGFLRLAIAYRLQEQAFGGLQPTTIRKLRSYARTIEAPLAAGDGALRSKVSRYSACISLSPGTRLMREWNGRTEVVDVNEDGFVWRGKRFKTLSATAVAITGTKWSGPKFFGLLRPAKVKGNSASKSDGSRLMQRNAA